jgi:hypothetical protein
VSHGRVRGGHPGNGLEEILKADMLASLFEQLPKPMKGFQGIY